MPEQGRRATFLGADFAAGRPRRTWHSTSQSQKRFKAAGRHQGRVLRLWRSAGNRASKIARTGLLPQAGFGAAIAGLSDKDLDQLRRLQETGTGGRRRGRNMNRQRLVDGDLAATMAWAPILEWAKEIQATHRQDTGACTRGEIAEFWLLAKRRGTRRWADVTGPIDATWLSHSSASLDLGQPLAVGQ